LGTNFQTGIFPQTIWDSFTGLQSPMFLGQNVLESSGSTYIGQAGSSLPLANGPQRWGDYDTMVFDPSAVAFGLEGVFWQVEEISKGGTDQSTTWEPLLDPTPPPHFVSYSGGESECNVSLGQNCAINLSTPAGLQNGDVVIATLDMGGNFKTPPKPPDSTWVVLPIANDSGANYLISGACSTADLVTGYVFAHVYGSSSETGTYKFTHVVESYCNGKFLPEIEGKLFGYRAASTDTGQYALYGYADSGTGDSDVSVGPAPANSSSEGTLLNIFYAAGPEEEGSEPGVSFFAPITGAPAANAETPFIPTEPAYLLADLAIPASGDPLEQYSVDTCCSPFAAFGWQLFLPEAE
jgi:hypothetical protein